MTTRAERIEKALAALLSTHRCDWTFRCWVHEEARAALALDTPEPEKGGEPEDAVMSENIWTCKIGGPVGLLPYGSDGPLREAVQEAYRKLTGTEPQCTFSGWAGSLTEGERAVVEQRMPKPPAPAPSGAPDHPFAHGIWEPCCGLPASAHPPADQGTRADCVGHTPAIPGYPEMVLATDHLYGVGHATKLPPPADQGGREKPHQHAKIPCGCACPNHPGGCCTCDCAVHDRPEPPAGEGEARPEKLLDAIGHFLLIDDRGSALALLASEREGLERKASLSAREASRWRELSAKYEARVEALEKEKRDDEAAAARLYELAVHMGHSPGYAERMSPEEQGGACALIFDCLQETLEGLRK